MLRRLAFSSTIRQSTPSSWLGSSSSAAAATSYPSDLLSSKITSLSTTLPSSSHQQTQIRLKSGRSQRGLYDGKDVRFGNNVPFSLKKTRRRWNPNVQHKRVYSEILDEMIPFHITTSALRSIDKYGGLDEYLLKSKHVSTKGEGEGQRIRNRIIQKMKHREVLKTQAIENGESVEDWDKIVLSGAKIKQTTSSESVKEES